MNKLLIIFLFFPALTFANILKEVALAKDVPIKELGEALEHLKQVPLPKEKATEVYLVLNHINKYSQKTDMPNLVFLLQSEYLKFFLDNPMLADQSSLLISETVLKNLDFKLEKNKVLYSKFAYKLLNEAIGEFKPFIKNNFLNNYISFRTSQGDIKKSEQLRRLIKYLSPWLTVMDLKTPDQFNEYLSLIIYYYFKRVEQIVNTSMMHVKASNPSAKNIFSNITQAKIDELLLPSPKTKSNQKEDDSLEAKKKEGKEAVKNIKVDDFEPASKEIDNLIKKESE